MSASEKRNCRVLFQICKAYSRPHISLSPSPHLLYPIFTSPLSIPIYHPKTPLLVPPPSKIPPRSLPKHFFLHFFPKKLCYVKIKLYLCTRKQETSTLAYRGVEQLVARQAHNLEVIRSSRVSATIKKM